MKKIPSEQEIREMIKDARKKSNGPVFSNIHCFGKEEPHPDRWGGHEIVKSNKAWV